jgi:two-component system NarL family sensor kinase
VPDSAVPDSAVPDSGGAEARIAAVPDGERLRAAAGRSPELRAILVDHAYRGVRVQFGLRGALIAFVAIALIVVPPAHDRTVSYLILAAYAAGAAAVGVWTRRGGEQPVRWMWLVLLGDVVALSAVTIVAGRSAEQSWTADVLLNGFFVLPLLAATQLRPLICVVLVIPSAAAYFAVSAATKTANTEPWGSVLLRTGVLAAIGAASVALSWVQRSRVLMIGDLAAGRAALLNDLVTVQARERAALSEQLHDGALQYVLAARQDLEDARELHDEHAFDRIEQALAQSSTLLRSTVTQLHPAVLAQGGLAAALRGLARDIAERAHADAQVDVDGWPAGSTPDDELLYGCARELLTNVAKHAAATVVRVSLSRDGRLARLVIADDGRGIDPEAPARQLADGHVGLASLRARVAAAGGTLDVRPGPQRGTVATIAVPA